MQIHINNLFCFKCFFSFIFFAFLRLFSEEKTKRLDELKKKHLKTYKILEKINLVLQQ